MDDTPKKPRADSKLDALPGGRFMELRERLLSNQETYKEIREWLLTECGVSVSQSSLTAFFKKHCAPLLLERRALAAAQAEAIGRTAEENPVDWDAASIEQLKQFTFQSMLLPGADPKAIKAMFDILLKKQALDNDGRKLRLLEQKAQAHDQAKEALSEARGKKEMTMEDYQNLVATVDELLGLKRKN